MIKGISSSLCLALIIVLTGCNQATLPAQPVSGGSETLFEFRWNLIELSGRPVTTVDTYSPHLLFYPGQVSRVAGSAGCNRLNGTFELTTIHNIKFSPLASTRMACPQDELQFITALGEVDNWNIINQQLLLNKGKKLVLKLQGVSATQ